MILISSPEIKTENKNVACDRIKIKFYNEEDLSNKKTKSNKENFL